MCMRCFKDTGGVVGASSSVFEAFNDDAEDAWKRRRRERDGLEPVVVATTAAAATSSVVAQVLASTNADAVLEGAPEQVPPVPGSGLPLSIPAVTASELNDGTEAKGTEKTNKCYGCKHSFPRKGMLKCSGCKIAMFCNDDCYKKKTGRHTERVARKCCHLLPLQLPPFWTKGWRHFRWPATSPLTPFPFPPSLQSAVPRNSCSSG